MAKKPQPIHRIVFDAAGAQRTGLHTYDAALAERWSREAAYDARKAGVIKNPYVVHFEPMHHGWPDISAVRVLRKLGADCSLRDDGVIEVRTPSGSIRRAIDQLGLSVYKDSGSVIELHAPKEETHGLDVIRSVHRLHADILRKADGSIEVRNLYHYPEAEPGRAPTTPEDFAAQHPLISKRQWAKIPQVASKRHWVVSQPEKKL